MEKIKKQAGAAYGALYEEESAVVDRLKMVATLLLELAELDDALAPITQQVKEAVLLMRP